VFGRPAEAVDHARQSVVGVGRLEQPSVDRRRPLADVVSVGQRAVCSVEVGVAEDRAHRVLDDRPRSLAERFDVVRRARGHLVDGGGDGRDAFGVVGDAFEFARRRPQLEQFRARQSERVDLRQSRQAPREVTVDHSEQPVGLVVAVRQRLRAPFAGQRGGRLAVHRQRDELQLSDRLPHRHLVRVEQGPDRQ